jgi:TrmH family RNA methyltransferase
LLSRVRVVLVEPQHPGNIGAAARAMKTMGLHDLALVRPRKFPDAQAETMAVDARDVLAKASVFGDLSAAVADCAHVAGSTARLRSLPHNTSTPREWAARAAREIGGRIALVFGPERIGLTNEEMHLCHELVSIPANPEYSALNIAAAVQVLAYEIRLAAGADLKRPEREAVGHAEMELLYAHLERLMVRVDFLNPAQPKQLLPRLRRLFGRAAPDANEMNILRGILAHVEAKLPPDSKASPKRRR